MRHQRFHRGAVLTLIMGVLAAGGGCATHRTHPYAEFDPPKKGVFVIGTDIVIPDPIPVSKSKKEVVHWSSFPGTILEITFETSQPPFRVHCNHTNRCHSDPIDESTPIDTPYAYHATVTGGTPEPDSPMKAKAPGDPKVIIEY